MRRAIELGGSAAFRVFHDHLNGTFNETCAGTLFVTQTNVTFRADDGRDTFEAARQLIKEIKTNKVSGGAFGVLLGGKDLGAFHIKVRFGSDSKNYNFAPLTNKKAESELIIALVKAYGGVQGELKRSMTSIEAAAARMIVTHSHHAEKSFAREAQIVRRVSLVALAVACAALLFAGAAATQAKKPITKQGLMNAVKINGLSTRELVAQIERRGVDFEMTRVRRVRLAVGRRAPRDHRGRALELPPGRRGRRARRHDDHPAAHEHDRARGERPRRAAALEERDRHDAPGRHPRARVEQFVEKRGVNFQVTPEIAREITAAGGNRSLVGAITEKSTAEAASNNNGGDSPFGPVEHGGRQQRARLRRPDRPRQLGRLLAGLQRRHPLRAAGRAARPAAADGLLHPRHRRALLQPERLDRRAGHARRHRARRAPPPSTSTTTTTAASATTARAPSSSPRRA